VIGDITTHYSAAGLRELLDAAERIVERGNTRPRRSRFSDACSLSEKFRKKEEKGLAEKLSLTL